MRKSDLSAESSTLPGMRQKLQALGRFSLISDEAAVFL